MSDDERKGDDKIDVKHLQEEIEMVKGWGVRHNIAIEDIKDSIRAIRRKLEQLETGNTGRRTGRSRRGNIRGIPAIPPRVGGRRTRRGRRKKGGVHLKQVHNIIQPLKNEIMNLKSKIADLNNSVDDIKEHSGIGGRRKKRTRRRKRKGGHAGGRQYTYTELAAMINANEQRVYYLYVIDSRNDPPLEQAYGEHVHRFKFDGSGNKIAITGHRVGHHNQNPVYTIPNPAIATTPTATEVTNQFYNPGQGLRREFRDGLTNMMGNLQMGGRRKKSTRRRKSRRRMRGKRKGKTKRKKRR